MTAILNQREQQLHQDAAFLDKVKCGSHADMVEFARRFRSDAEMLEELAGIIAERCDLSGDEVPYVHETHHATPVILDDDGEVKCVQCWAARELSFWKATEDHSGINGKVLVTMPLSDVRRHRSGEVFRALDAVIYVSGNRVQRESQVRSAMSALGHVVPHGLVHVIAGDDTSVSLPEFWRAS